MIQISAQYGDPKAAKYFFPLQKKLNNLFIEYCVNDYFFSIKKLSVIFRVSGSIRDFCWDGPERFKYLNNQAEFTLDLSIPELKWKGKSVDQLKNLLKSGLIKCCTIFLEESFNLEELKNKGFFVRDFYRVLSEFDKDI